MGSQKRRGRFISANWQVPQGEGANVKPYESEEKITPFRIPILTVRNFFIVALKTPTTHCSEVKSMPKGTYKHLFRLNFCKIRCEEF